MKRFSSITETCVVCCSEAAIPAERIAAGCTHRRTICATCVRRHINVELRGKGQVTSIPWWLGKAGKRTLQSSKRQATHTKQAGGECGAILEYQDVQRQASQEDFGFYDRLLTTRALEAMPEFLWCAAGGCGNGQLHFEMHACPIVTCHGCRGKTCFTHHCVWHAGRTCAQYDADARQSEEVALLQALERSDVKRCPRCKQGIEKNKGCDHMTCRTTAGGCGHEFCWLCLADYATIRNLGNSAHNPTCQYYA